MEDGASLIFQLIFMCVFGAVAAAIANSKGRSVVGWFFGGFFLGLIGIIIVACLSNLEEEAARHRRDAEEKRRLREQLKQEQLKSEAMRQYTMERLDAHDDALGIDTRQTQVALPGGAPRTLHIPASGTGTAAEAAPVTPVTSPEPAPPVISAAWYYSDQNATQNGPFSQHELSQLIASGEVRTDSLVWTEGKADWAKAGETPELQGYFGS